MGCDVRAYGGLGGIGGGGVVWTGDWGGWSEL